MLYKNPQKSAFAIRITSRTMVLDSASETRLSQGAI